MSKLMAGALAVSVIACLAPFISSVQAREYRWCAEYAGGRNGIGATVCSFDTLAQCRATVSGLGGFCIENPAYPRVIHERHHYRYRR
jgi:Protein of unknown function (DUF3551)